MMGSETEPEDWVIWCEVLDGNVWRKFIDCDDINDNIDDWMELSSLAEQMVVENLGFMGSFTFHRIFSKVDGVVPNQLDPIFHAVMSNGYATLNDLRTVYSLEDVFLMLDSITTTKKNEKIAMDAAKAEANNG